MRAIHLKTEYMKNPIGIDIERPLLSWNCFGGKKQTAYEIRAVSDGHVLWESGKVKTDRMNEVFGVPVGVPCL